MRTLRPVPSACTAGGGRATRPAPVRPGHSAPRPARARPIALVPAGARV